mmetsp:Transcript_15753/g.28710  ORF Transcript_15753/g.28710 Transcript_15753/m.28710 type:complete len:247 (-) Transcript_15753:13-753(-)
MVSVLAEDLRISAFVFLLPVLAGCYEQHSLAYQEQGAKHHQSPYEQQALLRQLQLEEDVERRERAASNVGSLQSAASLVKHFHPDSDTAAEERDLEEKLFKLQAVEHSHQELEPPTVHKVQQVQSVDRTSAKARPARVDRRSSQVRSGEPQLDQEQEQEQQPQEQLINVARSGHVAAGIAQQTRLIRAASAAEEYASWAKVGALMAQKMAAEAELARDKALHRSRRAEGSDLMELAPEENDAGIDE